ncbi:hypothetical protein K1T71_007424 [Dendrolimus kikuchii]|uniref:Uncharacterized protein n=1 Tax=Dendrolimus kikuchii TaxID=765133 RepID=A0ACC1D0R0_9NEOP|nr:hypothetical protein K1T71_007424 [Dendrolimus kikuchii]
MADDDEIDILGDFSFNSCFAQNNQGIPSCSNREDTVHPQWLLDSTATNWYDKQNKEMKMSKDGPSRKLIGNNSYIKNEKRVHSPWTPSERELLVKMMAEYGRNIFKISQKIKTKTVGEIQALIQAEYEADLDSPTLGSEKQDKTNIPTVEHERISAPDHNISNVLSMVTTGSPTIPIAKPFRKKPIAKPKSSVTKTDIFEGSPELIAINPSEILYEDDLVLGSTESIGSEVDLSDIVSRNIAKLQAKQGRKNYRRKVSRNYDKRVKNRIKGVLKSPQGRQRNSSASLSDDNVKSPKMQILLGSGQALPLSEGEQVIKIEKKKDSEPESDIEIDVDSDSDNKKDITPTKHIPSIEEAPIAVPLRKFEPMPRRQKKINLDGGGGYTIMHTESGDLYEVSTEPKREKQPRKQAIHLIQCRVYNANRPAPFEVVVDVSALIAMDAHAHTSRGEVMGLVGGAGVFAGRTLSVKAYRPARAAAGGTHCDMDPVSQSRAAEGLRGRGLCVCGWHHSHPAFPPAPSAVDLRTQRAMQDALEWAHLPFLGFITSQHWPTGRTASQYRCIRVEDDDVGTETPIGYQFSVKLIADLNMDKLNGYLQELRSVLRDETNRNEFGVDMVNDVCPQAGVAYLEKCVSSVSHHMRSAGYADDDPVVVQLVQGIRDIFR